MTARQQQFQMDRLWALQQEQQMQQFQGQRLSDPAMLGGALGLDRASVRCHHLQQYEDLQRSLSPSLNDLMGTLNVSGSSVFVPCASVIDLGLPRRKWRTRNDWPSVVALPFWLLGYVLTFGRFCGQELWDTPPSTSGE